MPKGCLEAYDAEWGLVELAFLLRNRHEGRDRWLRNLSIRSLALERMPGGLFRCVRAAFHLRVCVKIEAGLRR